LFAIIFDSYIVILVGARCPAQIGDSEMDNLLNKQIEVDGDNWVVIGVGSVNEGKVYLHLRSTTRFRPAKNGKHFVQIADWFPIEQFA
jgi:hypothetical protein